MLSRCFLDIAVGVGAFVIGLSQVSSLFSAITENLFLNFTSNFKMPLQH